MSESGSPGKSPKAIIHKRILETAEANPDASLERIADEISGASPDLVERVLNTYGDPGDDHAQQAADSVDPDHETAPKTKYDSPGLAREQDRAAPQAREYGDTETDGKAAGDTETDRKAADGEETGAQPPDHREDSAGESEVTEMSESKSESESEPEQVDPKELSDEKRAVLRAIDEKPEATQEELAEGFDVTAATISRWVNEIPGFEWQNRREFVARHGTPAATASDGGVQTADTAEPEEADTEERLDSLEEHLDNIQDRIDEFEQQRGDETPNRTAAMDPELLAKVVRACVTDERITEDEETIVLAELLQ